MSLPPDHAGMLRSAAERYAATRGVALAYARRHIWTVYTTQGIDMALAIAPEAIVEHPHRALPCVARTSLDKMRRALRGQPMDPDTAAATEATALPVPKESAA